MMKHMIILIMIVDFIIIFAAVAVILRKVHCKSSKSSSAVRIDSVNLNAAKENAANSFKASRIKAEKAISSSLNQIFNDQSNDMETDNSKELNELSSKLDDLLK